MRQSQKFQFNIWQYAIVLILNAVIWFVVEPYVLHQIVTAESWITGEIVGFFTSLASFEIYKRLHKMGWR